jgi:hypothetical protein
MHLTGTNTSAGSSGGENQIPPIILLEILPNGRKLINNLPRELNTGLYVCPNKLKYLADCRFWARFDEQLLTEVKCPPWRR